MLLVLTSSFSFAMMPVFALYAYDAGLNVASLLFLRFAVAAVLLHLLLIMNKMYVWPGLKNMFRLFLLGGVLYTVQAITYFTSVRYITPALASLLVYLYPLMVAVLSFFIYKERFHRKTVFGIVIAMLGLIFVLGASAGNISMLGVILAIITAFVYSIYIIYGNHVVKGMAPLVITTWVITYAWGGLGAYGLFTGGLSFTFHPIGWIPIVGLAFLSTIYAVTAFLRGLDILGPTRAAVLCMSEPVFTAIAVALLFGQMLTPQQMAGGAAVLFGAYLAAMDYGVGG